MAQKLMIVLLVLVAMLFVVTLALGASHKARAPGDSDPDGIGFLDGLQGKHFLRLGDKATTTCATSDSVTLTVPMSGCALVVEKRSFFSRPTRVAFKPAGSVDVSAATNGVRTDPTRVDPPHCYGSAVDHDGGTITVISAGFSSTTITLLTEGCPKDAGS